MDSDTQDHNLQDTPSDNDDVKQLDSDTQHSGGSNSVSRSQIYLVSAAVIIIIFAIVITAEIQDLSQKSFAKILTVGPVWTTNSWSCTSNSDFIIYGTLRGITGSRLQIDVTESGTQSLFQLVPGSLESFTVGSSADHPIIITSSISTVSGFLTLQTKEGATASCTQI